MCYFLTSIFSVLGLDFGASWASTLEPSCAFWGTFPHFDRPPTVPPLSGDGHEGSELDFKGSKPRFSKVWASILEGLGLS